MKSLASKSQVDTASDIVDKRRLKLKKLMFDLSYFIGKSYCDNDALKNYLVFLLLFRTFRMSTGDTETIIACKIKGLSNETIKIPTTLSNSLAPKVKLILWSKIAVEYKGSCFKQNKASLSHRNMVNLFIIYE